MTYSFINDENPPIKTKHICYYTTNGVEKNEISLMEVVEQFYPHPDSPENATISIVKPIFIRSINRCENEASYLILMEAQQKSCKIIENKVMK